MGNPILRYIEYIIVYACNIRKYRSIYIKGFSCNPRHSLPQLRLLSQNFWMSSCWQSAASNFLATRGEPLHTKQLPRETRLAPRQLAASASAHSWLDLAGGRTTCVSGVLRTTASRFAATSAIVASHHLASRMAIPGSGNTFGSWASSGADGQFFLPYGGPHCKE